MGFVLCHFSNNAGTSSVGKHCKFFVQPGVGRNAALYRPAEARALWMELKSARNQFSRSYEKKRRAKSKKTTWSRRELSYFTTGKFNKVKHHSECEVMETI